MSAIVRCFTRSRSTTWRRRKSLRDFLAPTGCDEVGNGCEELLMTKPMTAYRVMRGLTLLVAVSIGAFAQSDSASRPPAHAAAAADQQAGNKSGEASRVEHSDSSYVIGAN